MKKTKEQLAAAKLKVGDRVEIYRYTPSGSGGWDDIWDEDMHRYIGCVTTIRSLDEEDGVKLNNIGYFWSAQSLRKTRKKIDLDKKEYPLILDVYGCYAAEVYHEVTMIGCQIFRNKTLLKAGKLGKGKDMELNEEYTLVRYANGDLGINNHDITRENLDAVIAAIKKVDKIKTPAKKISVKKAPKKTTTKK